VPGTTCGERRSRPTFAGLLPYLNALAHASQIGARRNARWAVASEAIAGCAAGIFRGLALCSTSEEKTVDAIEAVHFPKRPDRTTRRLMPARLLSPTFLFRFSAPCLKRELSWTGGGLGLEERFRLIHFAALDGARTFAEVRGAWHESGLGFAIRVEGKRSAPWCRATRLADSDGFHVWIDTRDTHNVHRATRFCHHFVFLPLGGGRRLDEPLADQLLVERARENARPVRPGELRVRSEKRIDGYFLEALIPAAALTGFSPADYPRLGFAYAVVDRELGMQTFAVGPEYPFEADPSLWGTLELIGD
jgi:hypothetical protein